MSRLYFVIGGICVLLLLVIIFVAQNSSAVPVHIFVWRFHLALGLTMLLSAVVGGLLVLLTTGFRILHLRRRAGAAHKRSEAQPPATGAETVTIISSSPATGTVPSPEQGPPSS